MTANGWLQIAAYMVVLLGLAVPLGAYMARVYDGEPIWLGKIFGPVERALYRLGGVRADQEMSWRAYAGALLLFSVASFVVVYVLQRLQGMLPLNPAALGPVTGHLAFNTAVSFATNTNWRSYSGETTLSYLTQMAGLTVQNFVSAAVGMAVLAALARGFARRESRTVGNFWVDLTRSTLYILLPLSFILALVLVSQGVVQTFGGPAHATLIDPSDSVTTQTIAVGPAASQVAIKQLGTNGGGFFNVNSAHPFEDCVHHQIGCKLPVRALDYNAPICQPNPRLLRGGVVLSAVCSLNKASENISFQTEQLETNLVQRSHEPLVHSRRLVDGHARGPAFDLEIGYTHGHLVIAGRGVSRPSSVISA